MKKYLIICAGLTLCLGFVIFFYSRNSEETKILSIFSAEKPVTVLAFGDMMLDRKVRERIEANGPEYPFAYIKDFLQGYDIVAANAEGPFTYRASETAGRIDAPLNFTFDPAMLPVLKKLGFTVLSQANNHSGNYGQDNYKLSTSLIEKAGLNWFGDPSNKDVKPYIAQVRDEKIAFIGYNEFAYQGLDDVLQAINEAKANSTFIIVYPHWGEEYNLNFLDSQQKTAHAFIDAGADVVLGAHPHVIEPIENYKGKVIFYSLGNFIFDQAANAPTGRGLSVKISLAKDSVTYELFPFNIIKQQAQLMEPADRQAELDRISVQSGTIVVPR